MGAEIYLGLPMASQKVLATVGMVEVEEGGFMSFLACADVVRGGMTTNKTNNNDNDKKKKQKQSTHNLSIHSTLFYSM